MNSIHDVLGEDGEPGGRTGHGAAQHLSHPAHGLEKTAHGRPEALARPSGTAVKAFWLFAGHSAWIRRRSGRPPSDRQLCRAGWRVPPSAPACTSNSFNATADVGGDSMVRRAAGALAGWPGARRRDGAVAGAQQPPACVHSPWPHRHWRRRLIDGRGRLRGRSGRRQRSGALPCSGIQSNEM